MDGARLNVTNTANVADRSIALTGVLNPTSDSGKFNNDGITNVNQPNFYRHQRGLLARRSSCQRHLRSARPRPAATDRGASPAIILADGSYAITATAVDQFGVTTTTAPVTIVPDLVIDTVGPRVVFAAFDRLIGTVYYTFQDFQQDGTTPGGSGLLVQSLSDSANYSLNRVHARPPGKYIVTNITGRRRSDNRLRTTSPWCSTTAAI